MASSDACTNNRKWHGNLNRPLATANTTPGARRAYLFDLRIFLLRLHGQALEVVLQRLQQPDGVFVVGDGRRAAGRSSVGHGCRRRRDTYAYSRRFAVRLPGLRSSSSAAAKRTGKTDDHPGPDDVSVTRYHVLRVHSRSIGAWVRRHTRP